MYGCIQIPHGARARQNLDLVKIYATHNTHTLHILYSICKCMCARLSAPACAAHKTPAARHGIVKIITILFNLWCARPFAGSLPVTRRRRRRRWRSIDDDDDIVCHRPSRPRGVHTSAHTQNKGGHDNIRLFVARIAQQSTEALSFCGRGRASARARACFQY